MSLSVLDLDLLGSWFGIWIPFFDFQFSIFNFFSISILRQGGWGGEGGGRRGGGGRQSVGFKRGRLLHN